MSIKELLSSLNSHQRKAATIQDVDALVLAGAGSGKTKTIVARASFLIAEGVPADRIQILTFTKRAASEIVTRVKSHLGDEASQLHASTFHAWCIGLIHRAPKAFGLIKFSVIDRDDQLQLFKTLCGRVKGVANILPKAAELCDIYSFARNTGTSLTKALLRDHEDYIAVKPQIARIMKDYEQKKLDCCYLDFDDILSLVAQRLSDSPKVREWVGRQYDHLLVDEMQDTNPLQWSLLSPLKEHCFLFCVGDDAQSIYGFRGADFKNVHSFQERVPDSVVLKLTKNYRSTQEILDVSNWLLAQSPLDYGKKLVAARGAGVRPQLHDFSNEWEESQWITSDIVNRRREGDNWCDHMILARSSYSARVVEISLIDAEIPYRFIGGVKLLESAHIRDMLSLLRIVGNPLDEIAVMRYLTLFPGVGEVTASGVIDQFMQTTTLESAIATLQANKKVPSDAADALSKVYQCRNKVAKAITMAVQLLEKVLAAKYRNQDWPRRQQDFKLVIKLAEKHTSILAFIEEYLLNPIHTSMVKRSETDDAVTLITIHSGKGTESKTCYVINASPGSFPSNKAVGNSDQVEEERRVLYVALTRAMDNLIVTRQSYSALAIADNRNDEAVEAYFFNDLPEGMFEEFIHNRTPTSFAAPDIRNQKYSVMGINLD